MQLNRLNSITEINYFFEQLQNKVFSVEFKDLDSLEETIKGCLEGFLGLDSEILEYAERRKKILLYSFYGKKGILINERKGKYKNQENKLRGLNSAWESSIKNMRYFEVDFLNSKFDETIPLLNPDDYDTIPDQFNDTIKYLRGLITDKTQELRKEQSASIAE